MKNAASISSQNGFCELVKSVLGRQPGLLIGGRNVARSYFYFLKGMVDAAEAELPQAARFYQDNVNIYNPVEQLDGRRSSRTFTALQTDGVTQIGMYESDFKRLAKHDSPPRHIPVDPARSMAFELAFSYELNCDQIAVCIDKFEFASTTEFLDFDKGRGWAEINNGLFPLSAIEKLNHLAPLNSYNVVESNLPQIIACFTATSMLSLDLVAVLKNRMPEDVLLNLMALGVLDGDSHGSAENKSLRFRGIPGLEKAMSDIFRMALGGRQPSSEYWFSYAPRIGKWWASKGAAGSLFQMNRFINPLLRDDECLPDRACFQERLLKLGSFLNPGYFRVDQFKNYSSSEPSQLKDGGLPLGSIMLSVDQHEQQRIIAGVARSALARDSSFCADLMDAAGRTVFYVGEPMNQRLNRLVGNIKRVQR